MKLTKTQLKEIIREEIQRLKSTKLVNESWILSEDGETIKNPKTGRQIKVKTALSYPKDHPAYKMAVKLGGEKSDDTSADSAKKSVQSAKSSKPTQKSIESSIKSVLGKAAGWKEEGDSFDGGTTNYYGVDDSENSIAVVEDGGKYYVSVGDQWGDNVILEPTEVPKSKVNDFVLQVAKKYKKHLM